MSRTRRLKNHFYFRFIGTAYIFRSFLFATNKQRTSDWTNSLKLFKTMSCLLLLFIKYGESGIAALAVKLNGFWSTFIVYCCTLPSPIHHTHAQSKEWFGERGTICTTVGDKMIHASHSAHRFYIPLNFHSCCTFQMDMNKKKTVYCAKKIAYTAKESSFTNDHKILRCLF